MLLNYCSESLMYKSPVHKLQDKQFKLNKLNKSCGTSTTFYSQNKSENPCGKNKKFNGNFIKRLSGKEDSFSLSFLFYCCVTIDVRLKLKKE